MSQMHSVGKAARAFGWGEGCQGSQRGLSVASCSGRYIPQKKAAVLGEAKVEQRTGQKTKQGPSRGAQVETRGFCPRHGNRQDGPMATSPSSIPGPRGSRIHTTVLWVSFQQDTERHGFQFM